MMKHWFVMVFSSLLLVVTAASCASTGSAASKSAKSAPKYVDITVWKIQESVTSYPDGIVSSFTRFKYDQSGNVVKEEELSGAKVPVYRKDYAYSPDGGVTITVVNGADEVVGKTRQEFSSDRLKSETLLNAKDEVQSMIDYAYDAKGRKLSRNVKTSSGNAVLTDYVWDKNDLVKVNILDAGKNIVKRYDRVYDKAGLLVREDEFGPDGQAIGKVVYTYDGKNLIKEEKQNATGGIMSSIAYVNDANGNPIEIDYCDRLGQPLEIKKQSWISFTRTVERN